jgi:hypothetical protein
MRDVDVTIVITINLWIATRSPGGYRFGTSLLYVVGSNSFSSIISDLYHMGQLTCNQRIYRTVVPEGSMTTLLVKLK